MIGKVSNAVILNTLKQGMSYEIVASSLLFSILLSFYILNVGSYFAPTVYPLIDRVTYSTPFVDKHFIGKYYDSVIILFGTLLWFMLSIRGKIRYILYALYGIVAFAAVIGNISVLLDTLTLISIPIMLSFIIYNSRLKTKVLLFNKQLFKNYCSIVGLLLGAISTVITIADIFQPQLSLPPVNYLYYMYLLSSIFTPFLLLVIGLSFPIKWLLPKIIKKIARVKNKLDSGIPLLQYESLNLRIRVTHLLLIMSLSIVITIVPHLHTINNDNQPIGVDSGDYLKFLNGMHNTSGVYQFLQQAFMQTNGDRPLSLITLFILTQIFDQINLNNPIEYAPLILGPLLILSIYFLTVELTSNHITALLAAFLTVTSFHVLIGTYGGLYANWFSLVFGYLAIMFLFRTLNSPTTKHIVLFSGLMVITLLCHAPTWTILSIVVIVFLISNTILNKQSRRISFILFTGIIPSFLIDVSRLIIIKSSGILETISFANNQGAGLQGHSSILDNLVGATQEYLGGQFGNSIMFILVLYWLYKSNIKENATILIIIFFSLTILPVFVGDREIQSRVLFDMPFQIPAAIALTQIKKYNGNLFLITICTWLIIISIRSASNFYLIEQ